MKKSFFFFLACLAINKIHAMDHITVKDAKFLMNYQIFDWDKNGTYQLDNPNSQYYAIDLAVDIKRCMNKQKPKSFVTLRNDKYTDYSQKNSCSLIAKAIKYALSDENKKLSKKSIHRLENAALEIEFNIEEEI